MEDIEALLEQGRNHAAERSPGGHSRDSRNSSSKRRRSRSPYSPRDRDRRRHDDRDDRRRRRRSPSPSRRRSRSPRDRRYDDRRDSQRQDRRPSPKYEQEQKPPRDPTPEPEMSEEDREMRTVLVTQISARIGERELGAWLENQLGTRVRDVRLIVDRVTRRSKGVGYVEFYDLDDVSKAINLSGTKMLGMAIKISHTESERNRAAQGFPVNPDHITIPKGSDARPNAPIPFNRLHVSQLNFALTEREIREVFQPFGKVDIVEMQYEAGTRRSKGAAFVQFHKMDDAKAALQKMNGFELAGRNIRVGLVTEKVSFKANPTMNAPPPTGQFRTDALEDGTGAGNSISRIDLMHKLARTHDTTPAAPRPDFFRPIIPDVQTKCLHLKNMFDPSEETERDWDLDLRDDVRGECEKQYGRVEKISVEKETSDGSIYIRFASLDDAVKAKNSLNGRWFGGRQASAAFISDAIAQLHLK